MDYICCVDGKQFVGRRRRYYKNVEVPNEFQAFNAPVLSSNSSSTNFIVRANAETYSHFAYYAFDKNPNTFWRSNSSTAWIEFYNPNGLRLSSFWHRCYYNYPTRGRVLGSNDGSSFSEIISFMNSNEFNFSINVNSSKFYKYHRVQIDATNRDVVHCAQIDVFAEELLSTRTELQEVRSTDDYDFYEDKPMIFKVGG